MNKKNSSFLSKAAPSIIAVLIGLVIGVIIIVATSPDNALKAIPHFFMGPFNKGWVGLGDLFYHVTPVLMTGLSVAFAYQTGLFNIGASGQFLFGAFLAILVGVKLKNVVPTSVLWILSLLAAAIGGGLVASITGALKAYRNVNEVITSIMLNYTSMYVVNYLIKKWKIYNQLKNQTLPVGSSIPKMGLDKIFPNTIAGGGIVLAIIAVIILHIILHKTIFGFELKGVGLNRHGAKYAGISEKKSIVLSMTIAGVLAGLAGGMLYLSGAGNNITVQDVLPNEGFDGIAISLLGLNEPIGVLLSAILIAFLKMGGQAIQTLGFAPELITMIISIILYISALSVLFSRILSRRHKDVTDNINAELAGNARASDTIYDDTKELQEDSEKGDLE